MIQSRWSAFNVSEILLALMFNATKTLYLNFSEYQAGEINWMAPFHQKWKFIPYSQYNVGEEKFDVVRIYVYTSVLWSYFLSEKCHRSKMLDCLPS